MLVRLFNPLSNYSLLVYKAFPCLLAAPTQGRSPADAARHTVGSPEWVNEWAPSGRSGRKQQRGHGGGRRRDSKPAVVSNDATVTAPQVEMDQTRRPQVEAASAAVSVPPRRSTRRKRKKEVSPLPEQATATLTSALRSHPIDVDDMEEDLMAENVEGMEQC